VSIAIRVISFMDGLRFESRRPNLGIRCRGAVHPNGKAFSPREGGG
jgi:hypothetical protein